MTHSSWAVAALALGLLGAGAAPARAASSPPPVSLDRAAAPGTAANGSRIPVVIKLSCLPDGVAMKISGCKVVSVTPPAFAELVSAGAIAGAQSSKLPADWKTRLEKDGADRVFVPVTVMAERDDSAAPPPPAPKPAVAATPAASGPQVVVTLSCVPNPDLSVRDCQVEKVEPNEPGASAAALSAVTRGKLDSNWRTIYQVQNGRVILPVRLQSKAP